MEWLTSSDLWKFLADDNNRDILEFLGAGLVVAIGGAWMAYVHFSQEKGASPTKVTARDGGATAGGNINVGGDLNIGLTPKKHEESAVSQRDWNFRDALEWWEQVTGLNRGSRKILDFFSDIRQAACDGNLTVWGRANSEHLTPSEYTQPLQPIPAEHWTHVDNEFDVIRYVYAKNEDMIRDTATPPGTDSIPGVTRYVDLRLTSTEVKENFLPEQPTHNFKFIQLRELAKNKGWGFGDADTAHLSNFVYAIRQAGHDESLKIYGRAKKHKLDQLTQDEVLEEIPKEHWKEYEVDRKSLIESTENILIRTYIPITGQPGYADLYFNESQCKRWLDTTAENLKNRNRI